MRLVFGVQNMTRGGSRGVEYHCEVARLFLRDQLDESAGEAEDGRRVEALRGVDRTADQGEVRAVGERHSVEEVKCLGHLFEKNERLKSRNKVCYCFDQQGGDKT